MPAPEAVAIIRELEAAKAPKHSEARIIRRMGESYDDGQSNGDVLVAIIHKGVVITCKWRRSTQTFTAEGFRVDRVRDMTRTEEEQANLNRAQFERGVNRLASKWGARVK